MRAIVTVMAKDSVGIMAYVCNILAEQQVNIMDISQTLLQEYFTMIMLVDLSAAQSDFETLRALLLEKGAQRGLQILIQREDIFNAMHKI